MDDRYIPLPPREDTPSLWSNRTLREMDEMQPLLEPCSPFADDVQGASQNSTNVALPRFAPPGVGTQHDESPLHWPLGPARTQHTSFAKYQWPARRFRVPTSRYSKLGGDASSSRYTPKFEIEPEPLPLRALEPSTIRPPPTETSFLERYPNSDATISYLNDNGESRTITGVDVCAIEQSCPLLAAAFETRVSGPRLHLEVLTEMSAMPFLRYLYTGSYAIRGDYGDVYEDVPTSLLLHCQLYHLGVIYDLPQLVQQANVNIIRQCEFGCSSPEMPIHLPKAIKYAYESLSDQAGVLNTIVSYCVACFLRHRLADDVEFKELAFELRPFHQALCQESINRAFENDTAAAIIQMPFRRDAPDTYLSREDVRDDVVLHFHGCEDVGSHTSKTARFLAKGVRSGPVTPSLTRSAMMAFRLKGEHEKSPDTFPSQPTETEHVSLAEAADMELPSDSDYEMVTGPAPVEALSSDSDTDSDPVSQAGQSPQIALPIRGRPVASSLNIFERSSSLDETSGSSDSDWSLL